MESYTQYQMGLTSQIKRLIELCIEEINKDNFGSACNYLGKIANHLITEATEYCIEKGDVCSATIIIDSCSKIARFFAVETGDGKRLSDMEPSFHKDYLKLLSNRVELERWLDKFDGAPLSVFSEAKQKGMMMDDFGNWVKMDQLDNTESIVGQTYPEQKETEPEYSDLLDETIAIFENTIDTKEDDPRHIDISREDKLKLLQNIYDLSRDDNWNPKTSKGKKKSANASDRWKTLYDLLEHDGIIRYSSTQYSLFVYSIIEYCYPNSINLSTFTKSKCISSDWKELREALKYDNTFRGNKLFPRNI